MGSEYIEMLLNGIPWFVAGFACCAFMSALFSRFFKKEK
jgi:hypothetical protein